MASLSSLRSIDVSELKTAFSIEADNMIDYRRVFLFVSKTTRGVDLTSHIGKSFVKYLASMGVVITEEQFFIKWSNVKTSNDEKDFYAFFLDLPFDKLRTVHQKLAKIISNLRAAADDDKFNMPFKGVKYYYNTSTPLDDHQKKSPYCFMIDASDKNISDAGFLFTFTRTLPTGKMSGKLIQTPAPVVENKGFAAAAAAVPEGTVKVPPKSSENLIQVKVKPEPCTTIVVPTSCTQIEGITVISNGMIHPFEKSGGMFMLTGATLLVVNGERIEVGDNNTIYQVPVAK